MSPINLCYLSIKLYPPRHMVPTSTMLVGSSTRLRNFQEKFQTCNAFFSATKGPQEKRKAGFDSPSSNTSRSPQLHLLVCSLFHINLSIKLYPPRHIVPTSTMLVGSSTRLRNFQEMFQTCNAFFSATKGPQEKRKAGFDSPSSNASRSPQLHFLVCPLFHINLSI